MNDSLGKRLQMARRSAGYQTADEAIQRFVWVEDTYKSHEAGRRHPRINTIQEYAKSYGVNWQWLAFNEGEAKMAQKYAGESRNMKQSPNNQKNQSPVSVVEPNQISEYVPVYGTASAATPGIIRISEEFMVDQALRHPGIAHVKDSFALYVDGDSMSPRRDHGEMIYVHPYKEPMPGQDCVVVENPEGNALYKRYCGKTKDGLNVILKQFNPAQEFTIPMDRVRKIYSVIF